MLAAIYWWHTQSSIFLLVPIITALDKVTRFMSPVIFFSMAIYCIVLEHTYKNIQNELFGHHTTLLVSIEDIQHNEHKNNYKITGSVTLKESNKNARIQIFSKELPPADTGDVVEFKSLIFKDPNNPTYKKYLLKENIHGTTYCTRLATTIKDHKETIAGRIKKRISQLEKKVSDKLSKISATLFSSLFLGSKKYSESEDATIKDNFNRWGINHFLARSGLHVTLILFLIVLIGRLCLVPFGYLNALTFLFLLIYSLFSYTSTSFLRAFITALLALWCLITRVPLNALHLLTLTFLITIIYNPFLALFLDFQLTFLLTWGLCILSSLDF